MSPAPEDPTLPPKASALAASDAYTDRDQNQIGKEAFNLNGQRYTVLGYVADASNGFHATAYFNKDTNSVIIAYRGTDPDIKHHTRTTVQDAAADFTMVRDRINPQEKAADNFTAQMIRRAEETGVPRNSITVAGHSLGGSLAEIEAFKHGLRGATFNAYGAADLSYGVPQESNQVVTNYVMAGDVVSAASHHFGEVKVLASDGDIKGLKTGRYLDAPAGGQPPNPFLAMSLGDHSMTHFAPAPDKNGVWPIDVLAPNTLTRYEKNYTDNKTAIDHYRGDVYRERAGLAEVLRSANGRDIETTLTHLPPNMKQQLAELQSVRIDKPIQNAVEHNRVVEGIEHGLDKTSAAVRAGGQGVQQDADNLAQRFHTIGHAVQQRADEVSREAKVFAYVNPLAAGGAELGAKAFGYAAHFEADRLAETSHLFGQAANATSRLVADGVQKAERSVEQNAHIIAQGATVFVHAAEAKLVQSVDHVIHDYQAVRAAGHVVKEIADAARDKVKQGAERAEHWLGQEIHQGYDFLKGKAAVGGQAVGAAMGAAGHAVESTSKRVGAEISRDVHAVGNEMHKTTTSAENSWHNFSQRIGNMLDAAKHGDWDSFRRGQQHFANMESGRQLCEQAVHTVNQQEHQAKQHAQQQVHQAAATTPHLQAQPSHGR